MLSISPRFSRCRARVVACVAFIALATLLPLLTPDAGKAGGPPGPGQFCQPNIGFTKVGYDRHRKVIYGYGNIGNCNQATLELQRRKGFWDDWETIAGPRGTRSRYDREVRYYCTDGRADLDYRTKIAGAMRTNAAVWFKFSNTLTDVRC